MLTLLAGCVSTLLRDSFSFRRAINCVCLGSIVLGVVNVPPNRAEVDTRGDPTVLRDLPPEVFLRVRSATASDVAGGGCLGTGGSEGGEDGMWRKVSSDIGRVGIDGGDGGVCSLVGAVLYGGMPSIIS